MAQLLIGEIQLEGSERPSERASVILQNAAKHQSTASGSRLSRYSHPSADTGLEALERFKVPKPGPGRLIAERKLKKNEALLQTSGEGLRLEATIWKVKPDRDGEPSMKEVRNLEALLAQYNR